MGSQRGPISLRDMCLEDALAEELVKLLEVIKAPHVARTSLGHRMAYLYGLILLMARLLDLPSTRLANLGPLSPLLPSMCG
jgi:hypothetical protein